MEKESMDMPDFIKERKLLSTIISDESFVDEERRFQESYIINESPPKEMQYIFPLNHRTLTILKKIKLPENVLVPEINDTLDEVNFIFTLNHLIADGKCNLDSPKTV
jgi:hypothetical protein